MMMNIEEQRAQLHPGAYLRIVNDEARYRGAAAADCLHYLVLRRFADTIEVVPVWMRELYVEALRAGKRPERPGLIGRNFQQVGEEGTWISLGDPFLDYAVRIA